MVPSPWQRRGRDLRLMAPGRRQRHNDPHQMSRASTEGGGGRDRESNKHTMVLLLIFVRFYMYIT